MPRKISISDRAEQLSALALSDGYEFAGWVGEYRNAHSKITVCCPKHGEWSVSISNFVNNGRRCPQCGFDNSAVKRRMHHDECKVKLTNLALSDGYEFISFDGEYKNNKSRAIFHCPKHGEWSVQINSFINLDSRCRKCANDVSSAKQRTPRDECEAKIAELSLRDGFTFLGWVTEYTNARSRALIRCKDHGEWSITVDHFINEGVRCPGCGFVTMAAKQRTPRDECEAKITELSLRDGFTFLGFDGEYENAYTTSIFNCPKHGEWRTTVNSFINSGTRCSTCSPGGYSQGLRGTLYALLSDCGTMIKIGISNQPSQRHRQLERKTPFKFSVHREIHCVDGSIPPSLEKLFHSQFPSAGLKGFDGATEWRQMNPDITTWLELLA